MVPRDLVLVDDGLELLEVVVNGRAVEGLCAQRIEARRLSELDPRVTSEEARGPPPAGWSGCAVDLHCKRSNRLPIHWEAHVRQMFYPVAQGFLLLGRE